jgi:hypothetical protein
MGNTGFSTRKVKNELAFEPLERLERLINSLGGKEAKGCLEPIEETKLKIARNLAEKKRLRVDPGEARDCAQQAVEGNGGGRPNAVMVNDVEQAEKRKKKKKRKKRPVSNDNGSYTSNGATSFVSPDDSEVDVDMDGDIDLGTVSMGEIGSQYLIGAYMDDPASSVPTLAGSLNECQRNLAVAVAGKEQTLQEIVDSLQIIEEYRRELIEEQEENPIERKTTFSYDLPDSTPREKLETSMQEDRKMGDYISTHINAVIIQLLDGPMSSDRLAQCSDPEIWEWIYSVGLALQELANTFSYTGYSQSDITDVMIYTLLRELSGYDKQTYSICRNIVLGAGSCSDEPVASNTEAMKVLESCIDHIGTDALYERKRMAKLACALSSVFPKDISPDRGVPIEKKILAENRSIIHYVGLSADGNRKITLSVNTHLGFVDIGCTHAEVDQKKDQHTFDLPSYPVDMKSELRINGIGFEHSNGGPNGNMHLHFCPVTNDKRGRKQMSEITDRLPALNNEMRKMLLLYCPAILMEDNPPEPLLFVRGEQGMSVMCRSEDRDRVLKLTGGEKIGSEENMRALCESLSISAVKGEWAGIKLPDMRSKQESLFSANTVRGGILSGESASTKLEAEESGSRRKNISKDPLPRVEIVNGILCKNDVSAVVSSGDGEGEKYSVFTCNDLNIQILVSNDRACGAYVIQRVNNVSDYVDITPGVLRSKFSAGRIPWDSEAQFMRAVEQLIIDRIGGAQFHRATDALKDFPDEDSCSLLREDLDEIARLCEKNPWKLTVGAICKDIRAASHQTFKFGLSGCGATWLNDVAEGIGLRVPRVREQIFGIINMCDLADSTQEEIITGLALQIGRTARSFDDLMKILVERYNIHQPTGAKIVSALAREVGDIEDCEVLSADKIKHLNRKKALEIVLDELYPEQRGVKTD